MQGNNLQKSDEPMSDMEKLLNLFALDRLAITKEKVSWGEIQRLLGKIYSIQKGILIKVYEKYDYSEHYWLVEGEVATIHVFDHNLGDFSIWYIKRN